MKFVNRHAYTLLPLVLLVLGVIGFAIYRNNGVSDSRPETIYTSSFYLVGTGGFECSRDIQLELGEVAYQIGGTGIEYRPVNYDELNLYCQLTIAEEYKGKLEILKRPEVIEVLERHAYSESWIEALDFEYIKDEGFVKRLIPAYADQDIGCIIILFTPEGNRVYLEDETLETFQEMSDEEFVSAISSASPKDQVKFWSNLR